MAAISSDDDEDDNVLAAISVPSIVSVAGQYSEAKATATATEADKMAAVREVASCTQTNMATVCTDFNISYDKGEITR